MKSYEEMVESLAKEESSDFVDNSSVDHAAVLIKNMLNFATTSVDLFTGSLMKSVYERQEIKDAGKSFVSRGGKLRILIQDDVSADAINNHEFLNVLKRADENGKDNFAIYKLSPDLRKNATAHFLVMDKKGFRYEPGSSNGENNTKAVACFNKPEVASSLSELFGLLIEKSSPVHLA